MTGYGDRRDRIYVDGEGPFCDKAWHLSHERVPATRVLRCADCGTVFARCAQCNRGTGSVDGSMQAHLFARHRVNGRLRARVLPRGER